MDNFNNPLDGGLAPIQGAAVANQAVAPISTGVTGAAGATTGYTPVVPGVQGAGTAASGQGTFFRNADGSLNLGNAQTILGGIQTIGSLWNSFQQQKLAKESFALNKKAFETNLSNQRSTYNTALEDRIRARYATEGRTSQEADATIAERSL